MRFNSSLNVDVSKWTCPKMERENNLKEFKLDEELPKYGAGSEFGRDQREESRRKKYGIISKKYNPDEQPWILKIGGKAGKKFKGIREGGVTENASYYVFTQAPDGAFEAFPIEEWYNFSPIHCYKALSAEEAEEEFVRRDKVMNYFNIMLKKRQKAEEQIEEEEEGEKGKGKNKKASVRKEFKISDADDWMNLSDDSEGGSTDNGDEGETVVSKKKKESVAVKKKGKKQSSDEEALEESDEGDFDNREVDYITNSSSSEEEPEDEKVNRELKGVEDEEAFRKFDASGDEEEEEEENKETTEESQEIKEKSLESKPKSKPKKTDNSSGDSSTDTSDSDFDDSKFHSAMFMQKAKKKNGSDSASSSRANTPTRTNSDSSKDVQRGIQKRKLSDPSTPAVKRSKTDPSSPASQSLTSTSSTDGITEDAIRRYLSRKPMTASELLQKFKSKKTGMNSEQLVNKIAALLKKVNPIKHHVKNKMYFSLKS